MEISEYTNPYDFANPVTDEKLFAGRENELEQIVYYLNHGKKSSKPINLALIGERAAGKTSLLNMIESQAIKKEYLTVRIDLDEGDVLSEMHFFFKIFDSILNAAFESEYFGGHEGAIFNEYLNQTSAYTIASDQSFKPFLFPIQYAKAMEASRTNVIISEINYKRDLDKIKNEVGKSIILLFDECNVLSSSRILLEKVRNIFMNKTNYMLVFTGTNELFPVIDEIFSPIVRQFKKISVDEFKDLRETESCVIKPLLDIGLDPKDIFNFGTYRELHNISEGKPYEIQLICHNMFKSMQEGKQNQMVLNHSVLEDVRQQLESSQNLDTRPRLFDIKSLGKNELRNLNYLCKSLRRETAQEIINLEFVVYGNSRVEKTELTSSFQKFIEKEILLIDDKTKYLKFFGDDFDKIYTKYYARERGVKFEFNNLPLFYNFYNAVCNVLRINNKESFYNIAAHNNLAVKNALSHLIENEELSVADDTSILKTYRSLFKFQNSNINHLYFTVLIEGVEVFINFFTDTKDDVKKFNGYLKELKKRLKKVNTKIEFIESGIVKLKVPKREVLDKKIIELNSIEVTETLIEYHEDSFHQDHFNGDIELSLEHCKSIYELDINNGKHYSSKDFYGVQNVGYIFLLNKELEKAEECFNSLSESTNDLNKALCCYNKGILNLMKNDSSGCLSNMKEAINYAKSYDSKRDGTTVVCLIVPEKFEDLKSTNFIEKKEELDLIEIANNIILNLKE
jgi:hypothetical protein